MYKLKEAGELIFNSSEKMLLASKEMAIYVENNASDFDVNLGDAVNLNLLCATCTIEIGIVFKNAPNSISEYEERYIIKQIYLIIYEMLNTIKACNKTIKNLLYNDDYKALHKAYSDALKAFRKEYLDDNELASFRHQAVAHYGSDFKIYHALLDKMNIHKSLDMALSFTNVIAKLQNGLNAFITDITAKQASGKKSAIDLKNMSFEERLKIIKGLNNRKK